MKNEIELLIEKIKANYKKWSDAGRREGYDTIRDEMIEKFNNSFEVVEGRKYIKIVSNKSVWGFIVADDKDKKFRKGDILKPAGWATPARNFARGNVFENYEVVWMGA